MHYSLLVVNIFISEDWPVHLVRTTRSADSLNLNTFPAIATADLCSVVCIIINITRASLQH